MHALVIAAGIGKGKRLELKGKSVFLIGKKDDCDLVLTNSQVHTHHIRIMITADGMIRVENCEAGNQTYINEERLTEPRNILAGDTIRINDCIIIKLYRIGDSVKTSFTSPVRHNIAGIPYEPASVFIQTHYINNRTITIGRDQENDIVLNHPLVSRKHARIAQENGEYIIYDLNSTNGTYVDGELIHKQLRLPSAALIGVAGFRLLFDKGTLTEYDDNNGQIHMEVCQLNRIVMARDKTKKTLLDNISFSVEPKEFVAILGGSGAGKSTLLGALTGMSKADSGTVLVNGLNMYHDYGMVRSLIGYVPQDDIVHQELTVTEVFTYAAKLRMPDDFDDHQTSELVDGVITDLELTAHRNTIVRELSGGQRKRVSIGVEMLTKPSLFFLDEPTSGLDPGLERIMMELLRRLAKEGRTIILVTHATCNIGLCDNVVFLARGGKLAFHGTPDEALIYFGCKDFAEIYKKIDTTKTPDEWSKLFAQFSAHRLHATKSQVEPNRNFPKSNDSENSSPIVKNSAFNQWKVLTKRYLCIFSRDRKNMLVLLAQGIVIPFIISLVFLHAAPLFEHTQHNKGDLLITPGVIAAGQVEQVLEKLTNENKRFRDMVQCVSMMLYTAILLGVSNSAREIVKEQAIFRRERLANLKIHPYILSKIGVLAVICFIQTLLLVSIVSLQLGLPNFRLSMMAFFLLFLASMMMGLFVSALASNADKAGNAVILILILQIILSGAIVPMTDVKPELLQSVFYLALSKWGLGLVGGNVIDIGSRISEDIGRGSLLQELSSISGKVNSIVIFSFVVVMYLGTYFALKHKNKTADR